MDRWLTRGKTDSSMESGDVSLYACSGIARARQVVDDGEPHGLVSEHNDRTPSLESSFKTAITGWRDHVESLAEQAKLLDQRLLEMQQQFEQKSLEVTKLQ